MSLSYSGITNYGKVTLPSAEGWGSDNNILRDPPKSIHTRRVDKVGDTAGISTMISEAEDRINESIRLYPLGVNPMVSVSYGQGNGNGNVSGFINNTSSQAQPKLPYIVIQDGAFVAPIMMPQYLLPISRLPRTLSITSNNTFPDYQKPVIQQQPAEKTKEANKKILKQNIQPTKVLNLSHQITEPFEIKYVIKNPIIVSGDSKHRPIDITEKINQIPQRINENPLEIKYNVNKGTTGLTIDGENDTDANRYTQDINQYEIDGKIQNVQGIFTDNNNVSTNKYMQNILHSEVDGKIQNVQGIFTDNNNVFTDKYMQDTIHNNVMTNKSQNIKSTPIDNVINSKKMKELYNINYKTTLKSNKFEQYIHDDKELERKNPVANAITNKRLNIHIKQENQYVKENESKVYAKNIRTNQGVSVDNRNNTMIQRDFNLKPTIKINDGYETGKSKTIVYKDNNIGRRETLKDKLQATMKQFNRIF